MVGENKIYINLKWIELAQTYSACVCGKIFESCKTINLFTR